MGAIQGKKLTAVACPLCSSFSSKRITALEAHLEDVHGTSAQDAWDSLRGGRPTCACGCGGAVRWNGWGKGYSRVVNGHNGSIYAVCSPEEAERISQKRSESLMGKKSWAKGLTKETDDRVAKRAEGTAKGRKAAFDRGDITPWNKGRTAENDERIAAAAEVLKDVYARGDAVPWAKGRTKETDDRVAAMAEKVSLSLSKKDLRERLDSIKRLDLEEVKRRVESSGFFEVIDGLNDYVNRGSKVIVVQCKTCGDTFHGSINTLWHSRCFKCSPGGSAAQESIARWLEGELHLTVSRNDRQTLPGLEIDIHVPDRKFAIEYNGLYWHCHINKSPTYHDHKSQVALRAGIRLLHVFEDEWRDKRPLVENVIKASLGLLPDLATRTTVREMSPSERIKFLETNCLDGDIKSSKSFATFDESGMVTCCVSLRKNVVVRICHLIGRYSPNDERMAMEAAKKWVSSEGHRKIQVVLDSRFGGMSSAIDLHGLKLKKKTPVMWWWTDLTDRFNRFKFKADASRSMTEAEVASDAGVVKIWGCENAVYEMEVG